MKLAPLSDLVGQAAPLNPAEMQYRAEPARVWVRRGDPNPERGCNGCVFKGQKAKVCVQAGELARRANQPDCEARDVESDKTFIYVEVLTDPRQLDLTRLENEE